MKTTKQFPMGYKSLSPLKNFSDTQLQQIGSVAILYNETEALLHQMVGDCIAYPASKLEITSRINGTDGLKEILLSALGATENDPKMIALYQATLGGFSEGKQFRDAVVHSTIWDNKYRIGKLRGRRGKVDNVLLSEEALGWLVRYLSALFEEMKAMLWLIQFPIMYKTKIRFGGHPSGLTKSQSEPDFQEAISQLRQRQTDRQSLLPPPKFDDQAPYLATSAGKLPHWAIKSPR
ncbi:MULTISPECIES: hypothetical protein [Mesorhizobium]|uniref:hypothetical protein n=1 Tax=Mesorhizobium TaxID=68287 RepID=UPI0010A95408|nr:MULTISPECIES: hypothetical protein [Mesorhizobium]